MEGYFTLRTVVLMFFGVSCSIIMVRGGFMHEGSGIVLFYAVV